MRVCSRFVAFLSLRDRVSEAATVRCEIDTLDSSTNSRATAMMKLFAIMALYFGSLISWGETLDFVLACSPIRLDFRDTFISMVLFQGAYIWIKFREVAFKGVYSRKIVDKRSRLTKVVYEPRFKPPRENGRVFEWIYFGQYGTPEEASILYQIASFYYSNKDEGLRLALEDGRSFTVPPMTERGRSLTGEQKRAWVKDQVKKVYEDFTKEKDEAALLQELVEACQDQVMQGRDEVNVDPSEASLVNLATDTLHQETAIVSQMYNSGMGNHGLECASHSFGGMNEGLGVSNGHSLDFQEGPAIAASELTTNTHNGMGINQLDLLQTLVRTQQELISYQQHQISLQQQQIEELKAQISDLQSQQRVQQQQLQESRIQISELGYQHCLQQQLQDINQGVPRYEVDSEQSMHHQYHPHVVTLPLDGDEAQEVFI